MPFNLEEAASVAKQTGLKTNYPPILLLAFAYLNQDQEPASFIPAIAVSLNMLRAVRLAVVSYNKTHNNTALAKDIGQHYAPDFTSKLVAAMNNKDVIAALNN